MDQQNAILPNDILGIASVRLTLDDLYEHGVDVPGSEEVVGIGALQRPRVKCGVAMLLSLAQVFWP